MIDDLWYKNGVLYCLSVGTYLDANGDGIGDFKGLLRRLDYLHGLGVTAIWLMPFQPSPGKDDGYDISDYYGVNPAYGTIGDFVEFTHAAKQRGIRVVGRSRRSFTFAAGLWHAGDGRPVHSAEIVTVFVEPGKGAVEVPEDFWSAVEEIEGRRIAVAER